MCPLSRSQSGAYGGGDDGCDGGMVDPSGVAWRHDCY